ncbi:sodium:calcium antiporter [Pontivivens ytuae]|uniref:Sodium:calcium antiporter n=1 Tax=Pontivivens ytuae TaxID=2789856 RepID=A0A7S9LTC4_9RHOB|nr:sodium:calcium antiporter [Pontivivens ytuae]QPH54882.1 sodium:calcium antiporter [Pontivivens ytuae]
MFDGLSLPLLLAIFAAAGLVILLCGTRLTGIADRLADTTGLGEALVGGILLGAATSLPGLVASVTAALDGHPAIAASNAAGGIAAQTLFLVLADLVYRRANLEHAAADQNNLLSAALLVIMLALALGGAFGPEVAVGGVHPVSILLIGVYVVGTRRAVLLRDAPMWQPRRTTETREDEPEDDGTAEQPLVPLLLQFAALGVVVAVAGWLLAKTGVQIAGRAGVGETVVGGLMIALVTSLPELVTTLAAVRRGALQLAVGGIIGGNTFDALFLSFADIAYRPGSIYHAIGAGDLFIIVTGLCMTGVLLFGLIVRDRRGIGLEGGVMLALYAAMVWVQFA